MLDDEAQARIATAVEEAGRHCGLYATHVQISQPDPEEHPPIVPGAEPITMVLAAFDVGKLALSPRTLDPQDEDTRASFREIVTDEQREQVKKLKSEGMTGGLAELEADDPEGL